MIGIIVITHGGLGKELIRTAEYIIGKQDYIKPIKILPNVSPKILHNKLQKTIKSLKDCYGILVLTDMLGGTASNISLPFTKSYNLEIVSGVNLYSLLTAIIYRDKFDLKELTKKVIDAGKNNITDVKDAIKVYRIRSNSPKANATYTTGTSNVVKQV